MFQGNYSFNYPNVDHLEGNSTTLNKGESQSAVWVPFPRATYEVPSNDLDGFGLSDGLAPGTPSPSLHNTWLSRHKGADFQVSEAERAPLLRFKSNCSSFP